MEMHDLAKYLEQCILDMDAHIMDIKIGTGGRSPLVTIIADTPDGITVDQLVSISRTLRENEDIRNHVGSENYRLEVSSPGIGNGITEPWQFPRHIGRQLRVQLQNVDSQQDQTEQLVGELLRIDNEGIHLKVTTEEKVIPWGQLHRAYVQTKW
jgi:ribosome maturation factor RimP